MFEGGWTTSWPTAWRCGKEAGKTTILFPWEDLKFYVKKGEDIVNIIVMEHFNLILFHKSGPANKQPTCQSINQSINQSIGNTLYMVISSRVVIFKAEWQNEMKAKHDKACIIKISDVYMLIYFIDQTADPWL